MVIATSHLKTVVESRSVLVMETISSSFSLPSSRNAQGIAGREDWLTFTIFQGFINEHGVERISTTEKIYQQAQKTA